MNTYTSKALENMEVCSLERITEQGVFYYIPTPGELQWLDWSAENYEIAIVLSSSVVTRGHLPPALLMSVCDIQEALTKDGLDRAPCLSEDSQLQRLICFIGPEDR